MFFHGSLLVSAWGGCVLHGVDADILRFMERTEKWSCALLLLVLVICWESRWYRAVRNYKEAVWKQGKLQSITASLEMDEAINPGRGELICVHSALLNSLGQAGFLWLLPCPTWFHGALFQQSWLHVGWVLGSCPADGKGLAHLGAPGVEIAFGFQSLEQAPHTQRGLVAESELPCQHKTQECVPSEPPGTALLAQGSLPCLLEERAHQGCGESQPGSVLQKALFNHSAATQLQYGQQISILLSFQVPPRPFDYIIYFLSSVFPYSQAALVHLSVHSLATHAELIIFK